MINDPDLLTRQIMGNVPTWLAIAFYVAVATALAWAGAWLWQRVRRHHRGRRATRPTAPAGRSLSEPVIWLEFLKQVGFHRKLSQDRFAGIAHLLLFYGFIVLFIGTCLVFLEHDTPLHFFYGRFYQIASLVIDLGGVAFVAGLSMFLYRRLKGTSDRILKRAYVAALAWLLLAIGLSGFLLEGARIAIDRPAFERWSIVGYSLAAGFNACGVEGDTALQFHRLIWGLHAVLCVAFFAMLPWRFFSHMIFGPVSWMLRSRQPRTALPVVSLATANGRSMQSPGAVAWQDLAWLDLLQADACTTCGRCNHVCPANSAGKPLRPRDIVLGVREAMHQSPASGTLQQRDLGAFIDDAALWSCTTCTACNEACPVGIDVYDKIVEMRRGRVETGVVPAAAATCFNRTADQFNPFGRPNDERLNWAAGLDVPVAAPGENIELLYWVGCAGSFDPDGKRVSRAMIKILNHLGVNYHVLGKRERCTGDPARRMGEEGLFQELAENNASRLGEHGVVDILTHCPHCFNTFRNEYPGVCDATFRVVHHSEFLARMVSEGKLSVGAEIQKTATFHDPCYLGRGNGETQSPRDILKAIPGIAQVEMPRHGRNSFCCGAGGGSLWLDVRGDDRIENQRSKEAANTGADTIVTGCPFCKVMLEAGRQSLDDSRIDVLDLAELIVTAEGL